MDSWNANPSFEPRANKIVPTTKSGCNDHASYQHHTAQLPVDLLSQYLKGCLLTAL
jgi:hypothetical protein